MKIHRLFAMTLICLLSACSYESGKRANAEANNSIAQAQQEEQVAIEKDQSWVKMAGINGTDTSKMETASSEDLLKIRTEIQAANYHYSLAIKSYQHSFATVAKSRGKARQLANRKEIEARISEFKDRIETNTMSLFGIEKIIKSRGIEVENALQAVTR